MTPRKAESEASHPAIWEVAQRLRLYGLSDAELLALIHQHGGSSLPEDQVVAEAALHVRRLRNRLAKGDAG